MLLPVCFTWSPQFSELLDSQTANHSQAQCAADWFEGGVDSSRNCQYAHIMVSSLRCAWSQKQLVTVVGMIEQRLHLLDFQSFSMKV
jgi:hypothetical protein